MKTFSLLSPPTSAEEEWGRGEKDSHQICGRWPARDLRHMFGQGYFSKFYNVHIRSDFSLIVKAACAGSYTREHHVA